MIEDQPLVSVILISYNSSAYVCETLESIKSQSYRNIELIVSDDGSKDETLEICQRWIEENKTRFIRTALITTPVNTGIPANCNRGLNSAEGDWVKLIAGDDVLRENCIEDNIDHVRRNNNVAVLFSYVHAYANNFSPDNFLQQVPENPPGDFINNTIDARQQYQMLLIRDRVGYTASSFINRDVLIQISGYDEKYKLMEDNPLWLKLTRSGHKLHFMEKVTVNYRFHHNSVSHFSTPLLVSPTFLRNEEFRKEYIYPYLSWKYKYDYYYRYRISKLLARAFSNKSSPFTRFISKFMIKWINPFYYYLLLLRLMKLNNSNPVA